MKIPAPVIAGCIFLVSSPAFSQADLCRDILAGGIRDVFDNKSASDLRGSAKNWFCSEKFGKYTSARSSSTSLSVPIKGQPVGFGSGSNDQSSQEDRNAFCSDTSSQFSESDTIYIVRQIASPEIVRAWSNCMNRGGAGQLVQFEARRVDARSFILVASWRPAVSDQPAPLIQSLLTPGAECDNQRLKAGTPITLQPLREFCTQKSPDKVTAILRTTYGDFEADLKRDLSGTSAGSVKLVYDIEVPFWTTGPQRSETKQTGDHPCNSNCRSTPTRTNYRIEMKANPDERFVNPVDLACIGGPCHGFNEKKLVEQSGDSAIGSWDVWTLRTTWRLTVATEVRRLRSERRQTDLSQIKYGSVFSIDVPKPARNARLEIATAAGNRTVSLADSASIEVVSRTEGGENSTYSLKILPPSD